MWDIAISDDLFLIVYCPNKYITEKTCNEAVYDSAAALKLIPDWLVTNNMIKKLSTTLNVDENILYFNEDSGNVVFNCNEMDILNIDLNNINLGSNVDEDDLDTIILIRLLAWHIKLEKREKDLNEELMPAAWHSNKWLDWCVSEDDKKIINPMFIEELQMCVSVVCNIGVLKNFVFWGIETFCLLRYWNILSPKFIAILNYIKSLCIIFYAKLI